MRFRPAQQSDLPAIIDLHIRAWRETYHDLLPPDYVEEGLARDMAGRWRTVPRDDVLTIVETEMGEDIVAIGFAYVQISHEDGPYLEGFFVDPEWRQERVDVALFQNVRSGLRVRGSTRLWRLMLENDVRGRAFFRGLGGRETPPYTEVFFDQRIVSRKIIWERL